MFEVGSKVKIVSRYVDCYFFNKETGIITKINRKEDGDIKYLGIIVKFDEPIGFEGGFLKHIHNFHSEDLELIKEVINEL